MNNKTLITLAAATLLPLTAFTQTPPAPPAPPAPAVPPVPAVAPQPGMPSRHDHDDRQPKVPVTFLGVETSEVPTVLCDQLGLPKGFGLVVDYVVPEGPAGTAGVQQNDILKMLNDQVLTDPNQLAKLIRSFGDGTNVTLTVLRKGQEQKISVKLAKKEMPRRNAMNHDDGHQWNWDFGNLNLGDLKERMANLKHDMGNDPEHAGMIRDAMVKAREEMERAREEGRRAADEARRAAEESRRDARDSRRSGSQINIVSRDDGGVKTTHIDVNKAQITFSDDKGELRIDSTDGKKMLTAKDPQGRVLYSGPAETKEDMDKIPAEVRERYTKLQKDDIPAITSKTINQDNDDADDDGDEDDNDNDDSDSGASRISLEQVSRAPAPQSVSGLHTIII